VVTKEKDRRAARKRPADSTLRDVRRSADRGRWLRRIALTVLLLVVLAGAAGLFGVRSATVSTSSGGYRLQVTYPKVARAGLDVPWRVRVSYPVPPKSITIAVSSDYFRMFETQGFFPDPDTQKNDGQFVYFTYDGPPAGHLMLEYDAYIQPASQLGKSATVQVRVGSSVVASTKIRTWLVP
jgi:hypothetical protein